MDVGWMRGGCGVDIGWICVDEGWMRGGCGIKMR